VLTYLRGGTWNTVATVTITAPANGFVLLSGNVLAETSSASCRCYAWVRMHDQSTDAISLVTDAGLGDSAGDLDDGTVAVNWIFPVTAGSHAYDLQGNSFPDGTIAFYNPMLTALFVPFGSTGGGTLGARSTERTTRTPMPNGGVR
jgi:hypothetical protein